MVYIILAVFTKEPLTKQVPSYYIKVKLEILSQAQDIVILCLNDIL